MVLNWGIVVRGPIVPVSRLGRLEVGSGEMGRGWEGPVDCAAGGDKCCLLDVLYFGN
jgi:hypothetical protein